MTELARALALMENEGTDARTAFAREFETITDALDIESQGGLLTAYLGAL